MSALSPSAWYVIAIIVGLMGSAAAVVYFRRESPDLVAAVITVGCFVGAFGLLLALPGPPSSLLVLAAFVLGGLLFMDAARRTFKRRRHQLGTKLGPHGGPPDIEQIP